MERFVVTDAQWAKMEPHCLGKPSDPGRSGKDNRLFVEAVLDQWVDELRADDETAPLLADVLHRAWRIHVVQQGNGRAALAELVGEAVDGLGAINVCP